MTKQEYEKHKEWYEMLLNLDIPFITRKVLNRIYDNEFFAQGEKWKRSSARNVADIISSNLEFSSVFDIGCGIGIYLEEFHLLGKEVLGCDFSVQGVHSSSPSFTVFQADATKPIILNRKYDVVVCFEVAEHVHHKYSEQLVINCVRNSNTVLFTAAPIGQGGVGHINEQPYEFWIELFDRHGFQLQAQLSEQMREQMKKEEVVFWIANNLMLFRRR